jgi:hypothetical protein
MAGRLAIWYIGIQAGGGHIGGSVTAFAGAVVLVGISRLLRANLKKGRPRNPVE